MKNAKAVGTLIAGVAACILLAGCTSGATPHESTKTPHAAATAAAKTAHDVDVEPGTSKDKFTGAVKDVTVTSCKPGDGSWGASGTVTNHGSEAADYRIYVSFMSSKPTATVGLLQSDAKNVPAGKSQDWSGSLKIAQPGLTCVLRVERVPHS